MKIAGLQKNSFVDYPGTISAVVFTQGCNMNCFYCHNRSLIYEGGKGEAYTEDYVLGFLKSRRSFLDGVVISGGEPTLQKGLKTFIQKVKGLGYKVKLDTNGTRPDILLDMIENSLVDYVAMDVKAPLERYHEFCGNGFNVEKVVESITILLQENVAYEFRTTIVPQLDEKDILNITGIIKNARMYVLQQYRRPQIDGEVVDLRLLQAPHTSKFIQELSRKAAPEVCNYQTRGIG